MTMDATKKSDPREPDLDAALKAIAHPLRRRFLAWLKEPARNFPDQVLSHDLGVCASQIERRAGLSQSTVSAHLALLARAGLVSSRKVGQWSFFRREERAVKRLLSTLGSGL